MIKFEEAKKIVLESAKPIGKEKVFLEDAFRRILAEDIIANYSIPPFDNSAMDGFAIKSEDTNKDLPVKLRIVGEESAGEIFRKKIDKGQTLRIFTGALLPAGTDSVIPQEEVEIEKEFIVIRRKVRKGENVRYAGEDIKEGEIVLEKGIQLNSTHIGLLSALGIVEIEVYIKPKVGILATGEELKDLNEPLLQGSIRNSNTYTLIAQIKSAGAIPLNYGKTGDNPNEIKNIIEENLNNCDIFLTTGGVSVGKYDYVREAVESIGAERKFWKVAQKPGMPLAFYVLKRENKLKYIFGLPGNPGAVMITFEEYVRPLIYLLSGRKNYLPQEIEAKFTHDLKKKKGRLNFIRVKIFFENGEYYISESGPQGSGFLKTLANANGIALIPEDVEYIKAGTKVKVHIVEW
ncbi:molybdopterin molybdotransferase MoeA [Candidatus Aminicenantes bacterium AC-708-M15]|jgi:molybdopterin molybdotransferase|nr:molybdopterin molybdotransferase MoeA [SCandidatus Aminicenantes bacterium Aminicenantia_JdfR_composite]MCP2597254.1 molybdopterin molybdotransferase MoeA [Candidatus Aminicenantes bacterium AC-335-G13]MCP2604193.1 molybdopterin molybdotransferase MoeA [Candidatus Aminicenantes bacterium AC-708-M15]MCP2618732.1 molybdopterin molybdotransferase MoeA [Candidatus Aminicenantes bacterium AC-335-A11]